jgi:eukaryotic-like serine/threonine-protein kinase
MPHAPDLSGIALDGRYELHALIGEGTFGRVYRGRDRRLARPVAVKVIKPWWAEDPEWVKAFEREAQLLASVSDPGIVQIFDVGSAAEGLYYVAELVDGQSLASRLRRGALLPDLACDIAEQLARALGRAHARRVVHRDVKPANVLISLDGRIKVGDFGVARLAEGTSDGPAGTVVGTPRYMAPEQARSGATSPTTDVYGVGVVLYEMLAGHPPFQGTSAIELALAHLHDAPPALAGEVPRALVRVVDRALSKDPADRYRDGVEMANALSQAADELAAEKQDRRLAVAAGAVRGHGAGAAPGHSTAAGTRLLTRRRAPLDDPVASPHAARRAHHPSSGGPPPPAATRLGEPMSPRRNVNPSERRQRIALMGLVLLLLLGMVAVAIAIAPGRVKVPNLHGRSKARIVPQARHLGFRVVFSSRYSKAPGRTAIAQSPRPGTQVGDGATVNVVLSAGPAPIPVPQLVGGSAVAAQSLLSSLRLRAGVTLVPAPGAATGTVTKQAPGSGVRLLPGSTVALSVAEPPQWRPLTSLTGTGSGRSVPFRIRGSRWEIVYSMSYQGTCTFVFICSGPSATVTSASSGATVDGFDLGEGSGQTRVLKSGPGVYQLSITPGSDTARWAIKVDDYY